MTSAEAGPGGIHTFSEEDEADQAIKDEEKDEPPIAPQGQGHGVVTPFNSESEDETLEDLGFPIDDD